MQAQFYHAHHRNYIEDLPFWLELAARQKGPILELGCGTGRVLIPLARAGYTVYGLDIDAEMLTVLQRQVDPEMASRCHLMQADMAAYHLAHPFPLVLLPCNTLSSLPAKTRQAALSRAVQHLSPHGLFVASLPNPAYLRRLPPRAEPEIEAIFPHPSDGEPVQVSSAWQRNAGYFTIFWYYDHLLPDGRVERASIQVNHELLPVESYLGEFHRGGLTIEAAYGDFDQSPYTEQSPHLILLGKNG